MGVFTAVAMRLIGISFTCVTATIPCLTCLAFGLSSMINSDNDGTRCCSGKRRVRSNRMRACISDAINKVWLDTSVTPLQLLENPKKLNSY